MTDVIKFVFVVRTTKGERDVVGYLPFEGAEFCAHQSLFKRGEWIVAHARTSLRLPIDDLTGLDEALELARKISERCPSAREVVWDGANDGRVGHATGPVQQLKDEVKAVLAEAA